MRLIISEAQCLNGSTVFSTISVFAGIVADRSRVAQVRKMPNVGPEVGPTSAFSSCIPTGMHGPTCIFWANLTFFSLAAVLSTAGRQ
jgi:hypothetical protein